MKFTNHVHNYAGKDRRISLQETMNTMARGGMDDLLDQQEEEDVPALEFDAPDEMRFWLAVDPILSDLHKQLLDAKASRIRVEKRHGGKDPMSDVARDMIDSAQCAIDTRLIELRLCNESKAMVNAMIRKAMDEKDAALTRATRLRAHNFWREFAEPRKISAAEKPVTDNFWMVFMSIILLRNSLQGVQKALSIAAPFSRASANDDFTGSKRRIAGSV